ncbi:anti-sigma factor domain-containing protein [Heyndrickxia acidicola]|uniref:Anti-sigma-W factor RsiW n=1 Tax=Heyndrickxia acidicola TaxID=209389 RepID=A0ABU6MGA3_9BACI|nr:anti-sigma factor [Heyndrickxia acidicola]MED1203708.1 anti-sigma factor [Heyndrickxia acidicola]
MTEKKVCDLLIDYFNQQLGEKERKEFENHLLTCEECREELKELEALTEDLPFTVDSVEPPIGMKERILGNILSAGSGKQPSAPDEKQASVLGDLPGVQSETSEKAEEPPAAYRKLQDSKEKRPRRWIMPALAAALLLSLAGNMYLLTTGKSHEEHQKQVAEVNQMDQKVPLIPAASHQNIDATAMILNQSQTKELVVQASKLPEVKGKQVYQVWLLEKGKPYRAGTFVPDQTGEGAVTFTIQYSGKHKWDTIAITLEPTPESQTPKGKIIVSNKL